MISSTALSHTSFFASNHEIGEFEVGRRIQEFKKCLSYRGGSIAILEKVDIDEMEKEAVVSCSCLVESFIREFKHQLKLNLPTVSAANTYSEKAITETISKLQISLSSALNMHAAKHSETFRLYSGSAALQVMT